ncbi:large-conductance mechanosensitive channel protein MscL [Actinoalloteichus sp. AHMU CJ021]|uniref:Large-conductance mechanosensitive channel n=1 Tax=Actinoalloteichus caeruleus DSM 43889 TaxID=1120930 RepID=A0ABT1JIZ7_ACTCY|nr:large-conductance mechanosensitive channel protein MscL [Actinoalloteichus caeruleus]AUS78399.1 large-conductance mechanosensitive channel protein MscL [Actinoalloteichus sp. AHMU CJ021]MCP2332480.1 large conductance mechanosensitive channel [Actinoalloteichus caeruleus DSM 43889]
MLKGFKDFLMRGNVVELAVAVVIGSAFTAIVTAVTENLIQPILDAVGPADVGNLGIRIGTSPDGTPITVDFGGVITAGINFLMVAAVVYFIFVLPMNKLQERRQRGEEPAAATPTELELLTEIRDLLREQRRTAEEGAVLERDRG